MVHIRVVSLTTGVTKDFKSNEAPGDPSNRAADYINKMLTRGFRGYWRTTQVSQYGEHLINERGR